MSVWFYYDVTITIMASLKYQTTCRHKGTVKSSSGSLVSKCYLQVQQQ